MQDCCFNVEDARQFDEAEPLLQSISLKSPIISIESKNVCSSGSVPEIPLGPLMPVQENHCPKVMIPGRNRDEQPMLVNSRQAYRIVKQRKKRARRLLYMMEIGLKVDHKVKNYSGSTVVRKKDPVRARVAAARKRVNGLFVNKKKEL